MTAALRSACGDENIQLHHLRHTCASRLFLAMLYPQCPRGLTGQIYNALWEAPPPAHVRSQLLGGTSISRRGLYGANLVARVWTSVRSEALYVQHSPIDQKADTNIDDVANCLTSSLPPLALE